MATKLINDVELFVEDSGAPKDRPESGRPILFLHGLLWSHRQWEYQVSHFQNRHRCVIYDGRGQGRSEVPDGGHIDLETHYLDAMELIEQLGMAPCHVVGISMGGMVAMRLAARRPEVVASLTLADTNAHAQDPEKLPRFRMMNAIARLFGSRPLVGQLMPLMFCDSYLQSEEHAEAREKWRELLASNDSAIHRAVTGYLFRPSVMPELPHIQAPTLVLHGTKDQLDSISDARQIVEAIPDAELKLIEDCGHMTVLEQPELVNAEIEAFIEGVDHAPRQAAE